MPDSAQDQVTAYLAEVKRDLTDGAVYPHRVMERHAPRLLAAIEHLEALAGEWDAKGTEIWGQIAIQDCNGASAGFKAIGAEAHRRGARELREAISRALLGGEPDA